MIARIDLLLLSTSAHRKAGDSRMRIYTSYIKVFAKDNFGLVCQFTRVALISSCKRLLLTKKEGSLL